MNSEEMFNELGYKQIKSLPYLIDYVNEKEHKLICFSEWFKNFYTLEYCNNKSVPMDIDMQTLKAIYKKLEELGWI